MGKRPSLVVEFWVYYHKDPPFLARTLRGHEVHRQGTALKHLERYMDGKTYPYRIEVRTKEST